MTTEVVVVTEADREEARVLWMLMAERYEQTIDDWAIELAERRTEAERAGEQRERARIVAWLRAVPYQRENCADMIEVATHESRTIGAGR